MKTSEEIQKFKDQLESHYTFPATYPFKFIAPKSEENKLRAIVKTSEVTLNPSRSGKYVSISFKMKVKSSDEIIEIYLAANKIKGIISL